LLLEEARPEQRFVLADSVKYRRATNNNEDLRCTIVGIVDDRSDLTRGRKISALDVDVLMKAHEIPSKARALDRAAEPR
jgi:hypothetical protein